MNTTRLLGDLLGYDDVSSIDRIRPSFGADWADAGPAWILFGFIALSVLSAVFYLRYQQRGRTKARIALAVIRSLLLCLLLLILADPILEITFTSHPRPLLWVLMDGTDSMAISDEMTDEDRERISKAVDLDKYMADVRSGAIPSGNGHSGDEPPSDLKVETAKPASSGDDSKAKASRADFVRALLHKEDDNLLKKLAEKFRLQVYQFDRPDGVRALELSDDETDDSVDPQFVSKQVTTVGEVTALGNAFEDLGRRHATANLAAMLVISDFDQNSGTAPLSAANKLGVPVFTLGVGSITAVDLSVDLQMSLKMKKAESTTVNITLRQQELDGETVTVRVTARPAGTDAESAGDELIVVGEKTVTLDRPTVAVELPFTPEETGRYVFTAEIDKVEGEIVDQNNVAEREVTIIDDFLRLMYIEYEPTWEWRFVKEVFHRDKLVGLRGFRTYLRSSDPSVRETNELFLQSLTLPRNKFFEYDVIFLGDMPAATLSTRFCEMTKEFVSKFGGGLVVMAGPRFGPGELAQTPLADMLPVIVDPDAQIRQDRRFRLKLSPMASQYDFMRLGQHDDENELAWANLGRQPWYQPVKRLEPRASTVLAEHPTDTCIDGKTPQPLIAIRKYGRGEVIYLAHNEMWRLRRKYGELYYRQFWGQMIHRLGLSHALGNQKRFVVRTDRQQYQADEQVLVTIEAYDENFEPLSEDDLPEKQLQAELMLPEHRNDGSPNIKALNIAQFRPGIFETRVPVFEGGEYRVRVTDPVTDEISEVHFQVTSLSAERRSAVRNVALQQNIAAETNGNSYELDTISKILTDFDPPRLTEHTVEIIPLWSTWLSFVVIMVLMLGEWFFRKMVNLV